MQCQVAIADPIHPSKTIVAGDFGVVRRVTFSDGVVVPPAKLSCEKLSPAVIPRTVATRNLSSN